jgi:hypothetical protein
MTMKDKKTRRKDNVIKRDVSSKGREICQLKIMRNAKKKIMRYANER